jgi:hypothetical protein
MRTALKDSEGDGVVTGNRMSRAAHQRLSQRLREAPIERSGGGRVSERASESMSQRLREAPTERSEGGR